MADQWREPLSGRVTARILLQQPIPVFDRVRKLSRSSADSALYRSAERPRIAALTIRVLPHGRPRIAARQPSENRRGVSAEKGKFSVSGTVYTVAGGSQYYGHLRPTPEGSVRWYAQRASSMCTCMSPRARWKI